MFHFILPKFIFNIERWKWNDEYRVYVSNMGHFKDEHKKPLPVRINNKGYISIRTSYGFKYAHRLVLLTWEPIPNAEDLTVDHLDHNKRNNSLANLEWVTQEENRLRADKDFINEEKDDKEIFCIEENMTFKNKKEAADWLMKNKLYNPDMNYKTRKRIMNHIKTAAERKTTYNGYHWAVKE